MIFILSEGPEEKEIIDLLLDNDKLLFTRDDLLGCVPYVGRQLNNPVVSKEILHYGKEVTIYRVGDTQRDKIKIIKNLKDYVSEERIRKYCTKPELEILFIIAENMMNDFSKQKDKPCVFAKKHISYNGEKYCKSTEFIKKYFSGKRIDLLVESIKEYKRIKSHDSDELFLADLLK